MNKDIIYIEPENDITDILAKLKQSENKVVALVPPKKAGVLRSAVNVKLIAKSAKDAGKVAVLVTADPSIIKLAAGARIPVAKTLQSRPEIPTAEAVAASIAAEQVIEDDLSAPEDESKSESKEGSKDSDHKVKKTVNKSEKSDNKSADEEKTDDKSQNSKKDKSKKIPNIEKYRKWIIIGSCAFVAIVGFLIWALFIAPKIDIAVTVKTSPVNVSENITFTTNDSEENVENGKFLLEEQKLEKKAEAKFTATGEKDVGNKASGQVIAYSYFHSAGSVNVPNGAIVSYNGLQYTVTSGATLSWDGSDSGCESGSSIAAGCLKSTKIAVEATAPGTAYNIGAQSSGWSSNTNASIRSEASISGGTSDIKKIVTQADIDKAKSTIESSDDESAKSELINSFKDGLMPIDSSFKQEVGNATSSPAVGEEATGEVTLSVTTTLTMYAVDSTRIEQYIKSKVEKSDDQDVYSVGTPYFDHFVNGDTGYAAKIKTTAKIGPKITYDEILSKAKGHKIGEVQSLLKSINGVKDVEIKGNFFWVHKVPNEDSRINIDMKVEGED